MQMTCLCLLEADVGMRKVAFLVKAKDFSQEGSEGRKLCSLGQKNQD